MRALPPLARDEHTQEILDRQVPDRDRARSLADVARLNWLFGGRFVTLTHVKRLIARIPADREITVLDVGTGSADIPRALVRVARRAGRRIRVFAVDRDRPTLGIARPLAARYPEITFVQADAAALPVRPDSVDVVMSALTLHHLAPDAAVR